MAAIAAPVAGPVVKPMCWLPNASHSPGCRGAGPIIGRLSGKRRPRPAPGLADGVAEFDHAARQRHHLVELGER